MLQGLYDAHALALALALAGVVGREDRVSDDGVDSTSQALIIGLSVALGCTLVVTAALAAYKISARRNARRLMEEMRDSDL